MAEQPPHAHERTVIHERVEQARAGKNPYIICKLETCWVALSDEPFIRGHCVTFADPVVFGLNDLTEELRMKYMRDVARVGDALIAALGAYRINYETLCNVTQSLHTHVVPRFASEPESKRRDRASSAYAGSSKLSEKEREELMATLRSSFARWSR